MLRLYCPFATKQYLCNSLRFRYDYIVRIGSRSSLRKVQILTIIDHKFAIYAMICCVEQRYTGSWLHLVPLGETNFKMSAHATKCVLTNMDFSIEMSQHYGPKSYPIRSYITWWKQQKANAALSWCGAFGENWNCHTRGSATPNTAVHV